MNKSRSSFVVRLPMRLPALRVVLAAAGAWGLAGAPDALADAPTQAPRPVAIARLPRSVNLAVDVSGGWVTTTQPPPGMHLAPIVRVTPLVMKIQDDGRLILPWALAGLTSNTPQDLTIWSGTRSGASVMWSPTQITTYAGATATAIQLDTALTVTATLTGTSSSTPSSAPIPWPDPPSGAPASWVFRLQGFTTPAHLRVLTASLAAAPGQQSLTIASVQSDHLDPATLQTWAASNPGASAVMALQTVPPHGTPSSDLVTIFLAGAALSSVSNTTITDNNKPVTFVTATVTATGIDRVTMNL